MAGDTRQSPDSVALLQNLQAHPEAYELFDALRRIECANASSPRLGRGPRPASEPIRLGQRAHMEFAPRSIESLEASRAPDRPPRLRSYPLGLFGPQGALPLHLTEYAILRENFRHDPTFAAFADVFHHRMISLWYRSWADAKPTVHLDRADEDRFGQHLDALSGYGQPTLQARDAFPAKARRFFGGRLVPSARNAEGLRALLHGLFEVDVQIRQFQPAWLPLPPDGQLRMGMQAARMGQDATVGTHVRNAQHGFRITVGPMGSERYREFTPGGHALAELTAAVRNYLGDEHAWDLQLVLARDDVPMPVLGRSQRMGLSLWMGHYRKPKDADDLVLSGQVAGAHSSSRKLS